MCKWFSGFVALLLVLSLAGGAWADLVGHWKLDEGGGTVARDSSGNGNDGTLEGGPTVVAGQFGQALAFNNNRVTIPGSDSLPASLFQVPFTVAAWINPTPNSNLWQQVFRSRTGSAASDTLFLGSTGAVSWRGRVNAVWAGGMCETAAGVVPNNQWTHVAVTGDGTNFRIYINGVQLRQSAFQKTDGPVATYYIGGNPGATAEAYIGVADDVQVYNHALTQGEITAAMLGGGLEPAASDPNPADGATDVPRDTALSWTASPGIATHDVYFGTAFADVNEAAETNPKGVLVSQGQTATSYEPAGLLAYGQIYYWRVDEVNQAPDNTLFKGSIWSFTAEPYAYPVKPIAATASSAQLGMGPEKTIDGSGLTRDLHGTEQTTMWMSAGVPPNWIQYEFDKVYKFYDLKVWNCNQLIEAFVGFGAKKVMIETSPDGEVWTAVADVPEFAQAPGTVGYAANTIIPLGGVLARYVKLSIQDTWSGANVAGLSEVQFSYVPVQARAPQPASGATGVDIDTGLNWRPGREAASHSVYFSIDRQAVADGTAPAKTVIDHSHDPGPLNFGTTYFWKVDEVNAVTYPGDLWSFTTQEYAVVEDFESYTDEEGNRIYEAWTDGVTDPVFGGSTVGYMTSPFAERTIIHGGKQSMPLEYNNLKTPFYSETERTFNPTQDWTSNGADTLSLWLRGRPVAFLDKGDGAFTVSASGHDIWDNADDFRLVYKRLSGNGSVTVKLDSLVNTNIWAKAGVMIRESLDAGSPMAYMIQSFSQGVSFGWRLSQSGTCGSMTQAGINAPQWVKLTRTGNAFTAQYSANGSTWTDIKNADGTVTTTAIDMAGTIYIGLCVTSHNTAAATTAQFSGAATTGGVTGAWEEVWIGDDPDLTNKAAGLYLAVEDSSGKSALTLHPDPAAAAMGAWTQWKIPYSSLTGINLARVKKLYIGVGDRANPKPGGAGLLYVDDIGFGHPAQ
jgi:hypothetical protein